MTWALAVVHDVKNPGIRQSETGEFLDEQLSAATALIELYERRANSAVRSQDELVVVQREMKVIKAEIISALARLSKKLQVLQEDRHDAT